MFPGGFGFGGFPPSEQTFVETYRCYSMSMFNKEDKEGGDKIILPSSAFEKLARMHITYPMQFELKNDSMMDLSGEGSRELRTHVGVLEFTAQEGQCVVPYWIMQNLLVDEGGFIQVKNVTLPLAQYIKFRPQSEDFLEISNPKAVLESTLRNFSCVTKNDTICLPYNSKKYYLDVVDVQPKEACSIVEADVKVDFEAPPGYQEKLDAAKTAAAKDSTESVAGSSTANGTPVAAPSPAPTPPPSESANPTSLAELAKAREARKRQLEAQQANYVAFSGQGRRVDGKKKGEESAASQEKEELERVTVKVGTARRGKWKSKTQGAAFHGEARSLT